VSLGSVAAVPEGLTVLPLKRVALVRDDDGIAAISMVCTHMNCALRHEGSTFVCPCHGAQFSLDGTVQRGPATENLRHVRVFENAAGDLAIDLAEEVSAETRYRPAAAHGK
jgi:cytochrome b6-f complex iron-sulfur subunit